MERIETDGPRIRQSRRFEFFALFVLAPIAMATLLPPERMFLGLFVATALGLWLLHRTREFSWRDLGRGWNRIDWSSTAIFSLATTAVGVAVIQTTRPEALFFLLREQPGLMMMIAILYPLVSVLPQELVFRPLFFERYQTLLPSGAWPAVVLNAALFSFAHLMYWSWIVVIMTFFGGLVFGWAYRIRGSFALAVTLHSLGGIIIFALGLGLYFYSGNVQRPF
ncbi:MAG: CPBP family intramembrane glutamic endopeptidase [Pseudomonadota bacterium]